MESNDESGVGVLHAVAGEERFDSSPRFRVATDR